MTTLQNPTIVFLSPGEVVVEDRPPRSPGVGEVLIETTQSLMSAGTELAILRGDVPWADFPFVPGYCNVGRIVETGSDVDPSLINRRVVSRGSHARYVTAPQDATRLLESQDVQDDDAVFCVLAEIALNGVRRSGLAGGECTAVFGLGLLGQLVVRLAHIFGARPIIAIDVNEDRRRHLPEIPSIISARDVDEARGIAVSSTRGRLCDVVFEVTGNSTLIPREFDLIRPQGRFVQLGSPRGAPMAFDFYANCHAPSYTIIGAHNSSHPPDESGAYAWTMLRHGEFFLDLVRYGDLEVRSLISLRIDPSTAGSCYANLLRDPAGLLGVLIEWGAS